VKLLIPLFLVIFLSACEIHYGEVEPPPRPPSVHESALWTGRLDGGVFVEISKTKILCNQREKNKMNNTARIA
jgi:hypothetical protein